MQQLHMVCMCSWARFKLVEGRKLPIYALNHDDLFDTCNEKNKTSWFHQWKAILGYLKITNFDLFNNFDNFLGLMFLFSYAPIALVQKWKPFWGVENRNIWFLACACIGLVRKLKWLWCLNFFFCKVHCCC